MSPRVLTEKRTWLDEAREIIMRGGVVALPFERLFGLAADALREDAVSKVRTVKGRPKNSPPIAVIVPDIASLRHLATHVPPRALKLAKKYWPGPLTILLPARGDIPRELVSDNGLVGVRIPGESPAFELVRHLGIALTATSANPTGGEDVRHECDLESLHGLDAIVPGEVLGPPGSTVIDASDTALTVVRPGCIRIEEVGR